VYTPSPLMKDSDLWTFDSFSLSTLWMFEFLRKNPEEAWSLNPLFGTHMSKRSVWMFEKKTEHPHRAPQDLADATCGIDRPGQQHFGEGFRWVDSKNDKDMYDLYYTV
jgi:hypothetical protein